MTNVFSWVIVVLILATSGTVLMHRDWRMQLGALAVQYFAAFWLVTRHLPFAMGSAKLVTGWMVVAALGMTRLGLATIAEDEDRAISPRGRWFPIILMSIVALVTAGATPRIEAVIPGLVHLGITADILRVTLGLLTMLTGFEIIYAAVESSILVAGLLAITNLGLGLVGSYLLIADSSSDPIVEEEQT